MTEVTSRAWKGYAKRIFAMCLAVCLCLTMQQVGVVASTGSSNVTTENSEEVTPGQGTEVTPGQGTEVTPGQGTEVTPGQGTEVTPGQGTEATPGQGSEETPDIPETPVDTKVEVTGITLDQTSLALKVGETVTLKATVAPANATDAKVTWGTSDSKVVTVTDGEVKAVANGTAEVTAKTSNGKTATCKVSVTTDVSAVALNQTKLTIAKGKTATLTATVTPETAMDKAITWASSNKKVATVDANGNVKGIAAGTADITATTSNGKCASCTVTVAEVTLNATSMPLQVGKTTTALKVTSKYPEKDSVKSWSSSNKKVATVSNKGKIKGIKKGTATITVTMKSGATASCKVTVQKAKVTTKSLKMEDSKLTILKGEKATLAVKRNPISATEKITWTSSNTKVVAVNKDGKITAKKAGTATITAKTSNGKKATCKVTVKNPKVTLSKTKATIKVGKTTTIKIKSTYPANDKVKSYKSSNKKVATVDKNGKVTGKKKGTATITVTMKSGAKATFKVTVK